METNYSEALLRAMEIISTSVIDSISYDKTTVCTVVDDTYAKDGKYTVSNGSVKFDAYSSITNYKINNVVYVTIPDGDYDNQKFIVGKKVSETKEPFIFATPFDTIVDLTNNIAIEQQIGGLVANGQTELTEICSVIGLNYKGFTRFGIQAQFKSWLQTLSAVKGSFGLKITIKDKIENTKGVWEVGTHFLILDSVDMYGNPYSFESFFQHEKVFDISSLGIITDIKCEFYQIKNSFADRDGNPIPTTDEYGNELMPNLFVKDVYLCAGYNLSDIKDEYINLYTFDTSTYIATQTSEENQKTVHLRWVHINEGSPVVIEADSNIDYEIKWYRYRLGAPSGDMYSGVYWDKIDTSKQSFSQAANPDTTKAKEMYKAIVFYNNNIYRSNIITFENEKEVINQPTVDAMQALSIHCDDNTYGNYLIYDQGNSLIDASQSKEIRQLTAYFRSDDYTNGENVILTEATSITWTFPTVNSMFVLDELPAGYDKDTYSITRQGDPLSGNSIDATQKYRIKGYYSAQYLNNTVQVSIVKDGITYSSQKEFSFGQSGTTGTDTTLVIDFDDNVTAVTVGDTSAITLTARLYDYENNEVSLKEPGTSLTWEWNWYSEGTGINIVNTGDVNKIELDYSSLSSINNLYIIQVTVKGWGNYDLTAFLPIPLRTDKKYKYIMGASQVIYLADGSPLYYKKQYVMNDGEVNSTHSWKIHPDDVNNISIAGLKNNILVPPKFYIKDNTTYGVKCDEVWMQPVLVIQNKYPSAVVNEWDGKELVIDYDKGSILSTMIAAGSKDSLNQFSGVMLGDWAKNGDATLSQTGLYGFHQGAMSFGFKEDGTGFIGKDGSGRLLFDGDQSVIRSQLHLSSNGAKGMLLDFDDGLIQMNGSNGNIILDSGASTTPLKIGANFAVNWDGTLTAKRGSFTGSIDALGGIISGNLEVIGTLYGGEISGAEISGGSIRGAEIRGSQIIGANIHSLITSYSDSTPDEYIIYRASYDPKFQYFIYQNGRYIREPSIIDNSSLQYARLQTDVFILVKGENSYFGSDGGILFYNTRNSVVNPDYVNISDLERYRMGYIGVVGGSGDDGSTMNLGIDTSTSYSQSDGILLKSGTNLGLRISDAAASFGGIFMSIGERGEDSPGLSLTRNSIMCNYPAEKQLGFYARFR